MSLVEEGRDYVVIPTPVRERIYQRLVEAEDKVKKYETFLNSIYETKACPSWLRAEISGILKEEK